MGVCAQLSANQHVLPQGEMVLTLLTVCIQFSRILRRFCNVRRRRWIRVRRLKDHSEELASEASTQVASFKCLILHGGKFARFLGGLLHPCRSSRTLLREHRPLKSEIWGSIYFRWTVCLWNNGGMSSRLLFETSDHLSIVPLRIQCFLRYSSIKALQIRNWWLPKLGRARLIGQQVQLPN